jgi:excisionase family DNA binding protein
MADQGKTRNIKAGSLLEPAFMTIPHAARFLGHGESTIYKLIGLGKIEAAKAGTRTLLKVPSLRAYAASLPPASIKPPTVRKRRGASPRARTASRNPTVK